MRSPLPATLGTRASMTHRCPRGIPGCDCGADYCRRKTTALDRLIAEAAVLAGGAHPCAILGHKWVFTGCAPCGCDTYLGCSIPVYECELCGDCDYGDNEEADKTRADCEPML